MKRIVAFFLAFLLLREPAWAAYTGAAPLIVPNGGTGVTTVPAHTVIIGEGTSPFANTTATAGSLLSQTTTSADPSFTATPTLGVVSTTSGTLALASSSTANLITLQNVGATSAYNWNFPNTAGNSNQVLTSGAGGSTANGWTNIASLLTAGTNISITGTTNATITSTGAPSESTYTTSNATVTLASTNNLTTVFSQTGTKATTIDLPATVTTNGYRVCVKDGTNNFQTTSPTVKTTDSSTIDGTAGATGVTPVGLNQTHGEACFIADGTSSWYIE